MKINHRKIVVSTLTTIMGAAMVGSVAGTFAWYQYSTRATAATSGATAKCSENLQVKVGADAGDEGFKSDLSIADINAYLTANAKTTSTGALTPVTAGSQKKDAALNTLKAHPVFGYEGYDSWEDAKATDYVSFPLTFRVLDIDGAGSSTLLAQDRDLYLNDIDIAAHTDNAKGDVSDAIRVHFAASDTYHLLSKNGGEIDTHGPLDLNGDSANDKGAPDGHGGYTKPVYPWIEDGKELDYGAGSESAYALSEVKPTDDGKGSLSQGSALGKIPASGTLTVNVTIWLEGWQQLSGSSMWDETNYIGSTFHVGMQFAVSTLA